MRADCTLPPYYFPPGVAVPKDFGWKGRTGPMDIIDQSPDGKNGQHWHSHPYNPDLKDYYRETDQGWYVCMVNHTPAMFAKMRTMNGCVVQGVRPDHQWLIPQLLKWHPQAMLLSVVPEVLSTKGWQPPHHLRPILAKLRAMLLLKIDETTPVIQDDDAIDLAIQIMGLNYDITRAELVAGEWLNADMVLRIIEAAGGHIELMETLAQEAANASELAVPRGR